MSNIKLNWSKSVKLLEGEDKTLVANIDNAKSMFVSNECIDIINDALKNRLNLEEVLNSIEDLNSKKYFEKLVERLAQLEMWESNEFEILGSQMDISLDITNKCNLRCNHCCVNAGDEIRGKDISTNEMKKIINAIAELNPRLVTISGGEPLIRTDFRELTTYLKMRYSGKLFLMTNATLVSSEMAKFISENYDHVDVSIDGVDEVTCSKIRGRGVFQKIIKGIENLTMQGCEVTASMVITDENKHLRNRFSDLCENELHVGYIYRIFEPLGRGLKNKDILEVREKDNIEMSWEYCEKRFLENKVYNTMPQIFACQGAKREFQIDHAGFLYPCASMMEKEFQMGNVLEMSSLKNYILNRMHTKTQGYRNFKSYLPFNVEECKECNKQLLCFSCANEVRRNVKNGTIKNICKENKDYFDLYWRYYGTC